MHRDIKPQNILIKYDGKGELQTPVSCCFIGRYLSSPILALPRSLRMLVGLFWELNNICLRRFIPVKFMALKLICGRLEYFSTLCSTCSIPSVSFFLISEINPHLPVERKR